ncbi:manganese-dependent ADP-ribose CDP-alcohol diphosphatase [Brachionus plicatilis]|uniref:Manganese-dependent ADP-ribose CDP-alcohol diphosphatase n=1 Tax=Brachionus plicatilis TaxID=10195 RepID=A0A3M7REX5_BRAPC|nr:manganese-dependent ADP-ribose CDP-alcohol diphosphatase [Brachionus plicatilis]
MALLKEDFVYTESEDSEEKQDLSILPIALFGIITDIQYANVDDGQSYDKKRVRYYRNSLNLVREAVNNWKEIEKKFSKDFKFVIQLGDLIDAKSLAINDSNSAIERVTIELNKLFSGNKEIHLPIFDEKNFPKILNLWGNHEMYNFKRQDLLKMDLNSAKLLNQSSSANYFFYDITDKLRLIGLDFYEYSCLGYDSDDEIYKQAHQFLTTHNKNEDLNSVDGLRGHAMRFSLFNGGLSQIQLEWLKNQLESCKSLNKKAIVSGHIPIHPQACDIMCLAWNNKEVLELLWSFDRTVIAYFAGHDHKGGYFRDKYNIHHVTLSAVLETPPNSNAYATVKVYDNKISVEGVGKIGYYEIYF